MRSGHTFGMKIAISIPDEIFEKAERLARRSSKSRSELYSSAIREYLARHTPDEITAAMDRVCELVNEGPDTFVTDAARRILAGTEW